MLTATSQNLAPEAAATLRSELESEEHFKDKRSWPAAGRTFVRHYTAYRFGNYLRSTVGSTSLIEQLNTLAIFDAVAQFQGELN